MPEQIRETLKADGQLGSPAFADEQPAAVQQALPRVSTLVMNSLAELAGQPEGREQVYQLAQDAAAGPTSGVGAQGAGLVKEILVDRYHGTVHTVATATGLRTASVAQLFDTVTAAALGLLGHLAAEQHWNAQELAHWLRPHQAEPVPTPVLAGAAPGVAPVAALAAASAANPWLSRRSNWLLLAVSLLAVGEMGYILGAHSGVPITEAAATSGPIVTDGGSAQATSGTNRSYTAIPVANLTAKRATGTAVPVPVVLQLKNGLRQVIGANSTESKLYQFLIDPSKEIDANDPTKDWIGFDRIYFDPSKATLTNESLWQLSNVASILKRFPDSKIKLGGYTDNTGQPLTNLRLSKARAQAALDALASLGVPTDRLTAVGYGELDNISSNDTEEGRSVNRRVSMQVVQK